MYTYICIHTYVYIHVYIICRFGIYVCGTYMHVNVNLDIVIDIHIHIDIHINVNINIDMCMQIYKYACVHISNIYISVSLYLYLSIYLSIYLSKYIHGGHFVYVHVKIMYVYIYMHIGICVHEYVTGNTPFGNQTWQRPCHAFTFLPCIDHPFCWRFPRGRPCLMKQEGFSPTYILTFNIIKFH